MKNLLILLAILFQVKTLFADLPQANLFYGEKGDFPRRSIYEEGRDNGGVAELVRLHLVFKIEKELILKTYMEIKSQKWSWNSYLTPASLTSAALLTGTDIETVIKLFDELDQKTGMFAEHEVASLLVKGVLLSKKTPTEVLNLYDEMRQKQWTWGDRFIPAILVNLVLMSGESVDTIFSKYEEIYDKLAKQMSGIEPQAAELTTGLVLAEKTIIEMKKYHFEIKSKKWSWGTDLGPATLATVVAISGEDPETVFLCYKDFLKEM